MNNAPKVNLPMAGPLGVQGVQQVELDTNRPSIYAETGYRVRNAIAIPSRGIWVDGLQWLLCAAVPFRVLDSLALTGVISDGAAMAILIAIVAPLVVLWVQTWSTNYLRAALLYRAVLVMAGFALATGGLEAWY